MEGSRRPSRISVAAVHPGAAEGFSLSSLKPPSNMMHAGPRGNKQATTRLRAFSAGARSSFPGSQRDVRSERSSVVVLMKS